MFWQSSLWKARRELDGLMSGSDRRNVAVRRCLELLRQHPSLAKERHQRKLMYPLSFLLETRADLATIQEVYSMYPPALSRPVIHKENYAIYPLHVACRDGLVQENVIPFLAQQFPLAVRKQNPYQQGTLHLLLRNPNRSASVKEVETLLGIYGGAIEEHCLWRGTPLTIAFHSRHTSGEVLELLIRKLPTDFDKLDLGGTNSTTTNGTVCFTRHSCHKKVCLQRSLILCQILPKLKIFNNMVCDWEPEAFAAVLQTLGHLHKMEELTFSMANPSSTCKTDFEAFRFLLQNSNNLQRLTLDFYLCRTGKGKSNKAAVKSKVKSCLQQTLNGLSENRSLEELQLCGGIQGIDEEFFVEEFWPSLCEVLERNTTILTMSYSRIRGDPRSVSPSEKRAQFLLHLNRLGRSQFRNPSLSAREICISLDKVNQCKDIDEEDARLDALYTLLHEAPANWSSTPNQMLSG